MRIRSWLAWTGLASMALLITLLLLPYPYGFQAAPRRKPTPEVPAKPFDTFLWGVATAGFQSEGGDQHSNWAHWHPESAGIVRPGRAADFWHRYDEDMGLAAGMGVNAFRLSVEWSRLEPFPGHWDRAAIAHYRAMFAALRQHHLTPIITLSHWTMPAWIDQQGGWTNPDTPEHYARFVEKVVTEVAPDCPLWLTFNEPNVWLVRDYLLGMFPPNYTSLASLWSARRHVVTGHALAYDVIHRHIPRALVTVNLYHVQLMDHSLLAWPLGPDALDNQWNFEEFQDAMTPTEVAPPAKGRLDFLAYDYYYAFRNLTDIARAADPWLLPIDPKRLEDVMMSYHQRFGLPQLIAENGLATENGKPRPDGWTASAALQETVGAMQRAMARGANVLGYCYWTLTDNYEWGSFVPRFGLFAIDVQGDPHLRRVPTPTVDTYRQLIRESTRQGPAFAPPGSTHWPARGVPTPR